jgi:DNA mismatch repair protein MutS
LRQVALIVFLAHIGSFVPAAEARIGLVDRIFARVGAHDDIEAGQSTFLVEMAETAAITRLATARSLVLLDEIGRGTTSLDGLAIAQAVAEHLHERVGARTLFATHYYDLAHAAAHWTRARNLHVQAQEQDGTVVFLYTVDQGIAGKSYALHVARMAGMPERITRRALELVEKRHGEPTDLAPDDGDRRVAEAAEEPQWLPARPVLHLAEQSGPASGVLEALLQYDIASMTPIEALNALYALQQQARSQARDTDDSEQRAKGRLAW